MPIEDYCALCRHESSDYVAAAEENEQLLPYKQSASSRNARALWHARIIMRGI